MNELVAYKSSIRNLKAMLGLGCIHLIEKEEFLPYVARVIEKLNTWITLEDKQTRKENIKLFIEYYEDGLKKMIIQNSELLADYDYPGDEDFTLRYFIASWTNVYTTIYLELLYNYPEFFTTQPIDCHECCGSVSEDEYGNPIYTSGSGNLSASFIGCGCGSSSGGGSVDNNGPSDIEYGDRIDESEIDDLIGF